MSKKDYTKYSEKTENVEEVITEEVEETVEPVVEETVEETVEPAAEETEIQPDVNNDEESEVEELPVGVVTAAKLNVRKEANKEADVECVIAKGNEVTVNFEESTEDFYKVYGSCKEVLFEGYCVKEFIEIK